MRADGDEAREEEKKEDGASLSPLPMSFAASNSRLRRKRRRLVEEEDEGGDEDSLAGGRAHDEDEGAAEERETKETPRSKLARQNVSHVHGAPESEERLYTSSQLDRIAEKMRPLKYPMMYWLKGQRAFTVKVFKFEKIFVPSSPPSPHSAARADVSPRPREDVEAEHEKQPVLKKGEPDASLLTHCSFRKPAEVSSPPYVALRNKRYIGCRRFALGRNTLKCFYEAYEAACACAAELGYPLATSLVRLAPGGAALGKGGKLGCLGGESLYEVSKKTHSAGGSATREEETASEATPPPPRGTKPAPDKGEGEAASGKEESEREEEREHRDRPERVLRPRRKNDRRTAVRVTPSGEGGEGAEERDSRASPGTERKEETATGEKGAHEKKEGRRSLELRPTQTAERQTAVEQVPNKDGECGADGREVANPRTAQEPEASNVEASEEDKHVPPCQQGADKTETEEGETRTDDEDFLLIDFWRKRRTQQKKERPGLSARRRQPSVCSRPGRSRSREREAAGSRLEETAAVSNCASEGLDQVLVPPGPAETSAEKDVLTHESYARIEKPTAERETPQNAREETAVLRKESERAGAPIKEAAQLTAGCCETSDPNAKETREGLSERAQTEVPCRQGDALPVPSEEWVDGAGGEREAESLALNVRKTGQLHLCGTTGKVDGMQGQYETEDDKEAVVREGGGHQEGSGQDGLPRRSEGVKVGPRQVQTARQPLSEEAKAESMKSSNKKTSCIPAADTPKCQQHAVTERATTEESEACLESRTSACQEPCPPCSNREAGGRGGLLIAEEANSRESTAVAAHVSDAGGDGHTTSTSTDVHSRVPRDTDRARVAQDADVQGGKMENEGTLTAGGIPQACGMDTCDPLAGIQEGCEESEEEREKQRGDYESDEKLDLCGRAAGGSTPRYTGRSKGHGCWRRSEEDPREALGENPAPAAQQGREEGEQDEREESGLAPAKTTGTTGKSYHCHDVFVAHCSESRPDPPVSPQTLILPHLLFTLPLLRGHPRGVQRQ